MTRIFLFVSLAFALVFCKGKKEPDPLPEVAGIVGKWRMIENIVVREGSTIVEPIAKENAYVFGFRYDGTPVDESGRRLCCAPTSYTLNGAPFVIKKDGDLPPYNPDCALVNCASCPEWTLTQKGDLLTISSCYNSKSNYVRE